ncbi:cache domain-containing protein [Homoserinibacter sp. GY 40078]|uniref:cache domain-containing protein n=1 Tax=Homoserinibacter sp. GY 40078 TaxID=2603275 RepID=UPI0011C8101D|nr:cache domain-containing protein [Homoserinibacter sp. GY 40078]TXK19489.1 hypothetical protein FVQ89_06265 [Homoserinibacter sp. GY 40078]
MTTTVLHTPARAADEVASIIEGLYATVDVWRAELAGHLAAPEQLSAARIDPLVEAFAVPAVTDDPLITGAGFVAAPGLLEDAHWHLAWWLGSPGSGVRRLATVDDETSDQFRDYTALEWWRVPFRTGARHLTGPYVDYLCTDDYTVTLTVPIVADGEFLGVVGCDALVERIESRLLPALSALDAPAAIVNAAGRIVTATDARREPGAILRLAGLTEALAPLRDAHPISVATQLPGGESVRSCGASGLALIVG